MGVSWACLETLTADLKRSRLNKQGVAGGGGASQLVVSCGGSVFDRVSEKSRKGHIYFVLTV